MHKICNFLNFRVRRTLTSWTEEYDGIFFEIFRLFTRVVLGGIVPPCDSFVFCSTLLYAFSVFSGEVRLLVLHPSSSLDRSSDDSPFFSIHSHYFPNDYFHASKVSSAIEPSWLRSSHPSGEYLLFYHISNRTWIFFPRDDDRSSKNTDLYDLDGSSCVFGKFGLLAGVIMSMDEWNVNMFWDCMAWIGMISGHVTHQALISKWLRQLGRDLRRCVPGNDKPRSWSIFVDPFRTSRGYK
jgi:hypothetical protein